MLLICFPNPCLRLRNPRLMAYRANRSRNGMPHESDRCNTDCDVGINHNIDANIEPRHENEVAYLK